MSSEYSRRGRNWFTAMGVLFMAFWQDRIPPEHSIVQIRCCPEGSGRFPEACPEAYTCMSFASQFQKVPEGCPEACLVFVQEAPFPEGSGWFPEACLEAC